MEFILGIIVIAVVIILAPFMVGIAVGIPLCFVHPLLGISVGIAVTYIIYHTIEKE